MSLSEQLISLIATASCVGCGIEHKTLCLACATSEILPFGERCWRCNQLSFGGQTCVSCRSFKGPTLVWITTEYQGLSSEIIKVFKYNHVRAISSEISRLMIGTLKAFCPDEAIKRRNYLVVHVPTASARARLRGFDHSKRLAKTIARFGQFEYSDSLGRLGQSRQVGASKDIRLKQVKGLYYAKNQKQLAGRNILLVDDVVTTGATLKECATILRKAGARRIDGLVFAKRL